MELVDMLEIGKKTSEEIFNFCFEASKTLKSIPSPLDERSSFLMCELMGAAFNFKMDNDCIMLVLDICFDVKDPIPELSSHVFYYLFTWFKEPFIFFKYLIESEKFRLSANGVSKLNHNTLIRHKEGLEIVKYMVTSHGFDINQKDDYGKTLLHSLCQEVEHFALNLPLFFDFFNFFLLHQVDFSILDKYCSPPLHLLFSSSVTDHGVEIINCILENDNINIDIDAQDQNGMTLLHLASQTTKYMPSDGNYNDNLQSDSIDRVQNEYTLLNDLNTTAASTTPATKTTNTTHPSPWVGLFINLIEKRGANVNIKSSKGLTAFHYVAKSINDVSCVDILEYLCNLPQIYSDEKL
jgi:ankyrin repeat protein